MQEKVVNYLMTNIEKNNDLDKVKLAEIKYGIMGMYSMITKTFAIFVIAIVLNFFKDFLIFMLFYIPLRSLGFGAHAKSNFQCWIFSTLLVIGLPYLICNFLNINLLIKILVWSVCFISFFVFCPADTEKRPMINKKRKLKFKIVLLLLDLIYLVLILKFESLSNYIIAALILQTFLSSPLGYILMGQKIRFCLNDLYFLNKKRKE